MSFARALGANTTNYGGMDPIQGFDAGVWVYDQQNPANQVLAGQFTSIVITVRNATEAYLEMGQRIPRYLDGEIQIAYVLEKGWLDVNCLQQTFGLHGMTRARRFGRSPRLKLVCSVRSVDEDVLNNTNDAGVPQPITKDIGFGSSGVTRNVAGQVCLVNCKPDSWHVALSAGRQVAATQWQGVSEGIFVKQNDANSARFARSATAASGVGLDALNDSETNASGRTYVAISTSDRAFLPAGEALFT